MLSSSRHGYSAHFRANLVISLLIILFQAQFTFGTLQHIQLFFRHGQRTPTSFLTFPNEPPPSVDIGQLDLGELTQEGMWQEFRLGMQLRSLYGQFLGDFYRSREINIYSGRDNRTVASAQLALASLFPPRGDQIWNRALLWQPIPVETQPILDHPSFGMFDHCPGEKTRVQGVKGFAELGDKFAGDISELEAKTGLAIPDLNILQKVQDAIVTRGELPKLLPLPSWARRPEFMARMNKARLALHSGLIDLFLDGMGGWHFDQILARMDESVQNTTQLKAVLYSSHDTNFLTIGRYLNVELIDNLFPDYASLLAIELHRGEGKDQKENEHFVEIKFRMGLNGNLTRLNIAECPAPCPLAKFRTLRPRVDTAHWMAQCTTGAALGAPNEEGDQCTLYGSIAGALLVLVVLLIASMFSLLLSCRSYKRRYERMMEDEKTPLLFNGRKAEKR